MSVICFLTTKLHRCLPRLGGQDGFTMVLAMGALLVGLMFVIAAYDAVGSDLPTARQDQDRKAAYAAAEAGANYYLFQLDQDNAYWTKCTSVPPPSSTEASPVNQQWSGSGSDPRVWRSLPGSPAKYTIELLPATGYSQCIAGNDASMLDPSSGTFRIRATGIMRGVKRSIVATFKRRGFIDYLYSTDYETVDPLVYSTNPQTQAQYRSSCVKYHYQGRQSPCIDIQFRTGDQVNGPLHTNDSLDICGTPSFGLGSADTIEQSGPSPWAPSTCSPNPPTVGPGTLQANAAILPIPTSNVALANQAAPAYRFTGRTDITLTGTTMQVANSHLSPSPQTLPLPANGVVSVLSDGTCTSQYNVIETYAEGTGCGIAYVHGTYTKDLSITTARDIVVNGDIVNGADAVLGLVPTNFARIYHPVDYSNGSCPNLPGTMSSVRIDAAILALNDSFIVDNYFCGAALGTLTVNGAIAQEFRGPVGTTNGSATTGYIKSYGYDRRFQYRSPPYYLDPVQAAWLVRRQVEQVPAR